MLLLKVQQLLGDNVTQAATEEPPTHTEGENDDMEMQETKEDKAGKEQEPERPTRAVLISTVRPLMRTHPELEMMTSHVIVKLTDTTLEFPTSQDGVEIELTGSSTPQQISLEVRPTPDAPILVPYEINGKNFQLTKEQIQAHMDKEERIKKKAEEAKLLVMTKSELIKVVHEEAEKVRIDPKTIKSAKGGEQSKKI
ncbi:hypothetical protein Tco_0747202 [Tanacetum coccineum]